MIYSILSTSIKNTNNNQVNLSLESLDYGMEVRDLSSALEKNKEDLNKLVESLDVIISIENDLAILDKNIDKIDTDMFVNTLGNISLEGMKLFGHNNELTNTVDELISLADEDLSLAIEEYKKKRNSVLDQVIRKVWDTLELIVSGDAWMSGFNTLEHLFTSEKKRLELLKLYTDEIKSKKRVLKDEINLSGKTRRMLGVYSCREDEFDYKKLHNYLSDVHKLFTSGIIDKALEDIHDSLVQSIDNEKMLSTHKESIDFIKQFKRIDLPEVDIADIKIAVPVYVIDAIFGVLTIVQSNAEGMDYENIHRKVPSELYEDLKIGKLKEDDIIAINQLLDKIIPELRKHTNKKNFKHVLKEFVKNLRSRLATIIYSGAFSVFALRRLIRQIFLANTFVNTLIEIQISQYAEWTKVAELQIRLIEETTEVK